MDMGRFSFVARMPDRPGSMQRAAEIVKRHEGNIKRIHYDRRIDSYTVFFEVTCGPEQYAQMNEELQAIGFLQISLAPLSFLKFNIYLANRAGALFEFLSHTTSAGANIAYMDFDDRGADPDRLTVSLTIEEDAAVDTLLNELKPRYRLEILEYDTTGRNLDDTVFYIRFAQQLRELLGETEDQFLMRLLHDVNHIVQSLTNLGQDPKQAFDSILETGRELKRTTGPGFYADVQRVKVRSGELICLQLPCGGNVYLLRSGHDTAMIDTGYGIYHDDLVKAMHSLGIEEDAVSKIFLTHADADHAGAAGYFKARSYMHPGTMEILLRANRAYGSKIEGSILEEVYTRLINLFSRFNPPAVGEYLYPDAKGREGAFDVIGELTVGRLRFKVLNGLGGHLHGQIYFLCEREGLLFTGDSLINFASFTPERERYNSLAKILMTTVNVDSDAAREERIGLMRIAKEMDAEQRRRGKRCLVCGGHGALSVLDGEKLVPFGEPVRLTGAH